MAVQIGAFGFEVSADVSPALRAIEQLERRAKQANDALSHSLSGSANINTSPAIQALTALDARSKASLAAANFTATPKVNTQPAQSALSGLGAGLKSAFALGAGAAGVTVGIGAVHQALSGVIGATQEAKQAQFALNAVYGSGASQFATFADAQAEALGKSSAEFERAAVVTGTLSKNYGLTAEQIQTLIKRSTDLGAIQGVDVVDATKRVSDAIRGEAESAELLGLTLNSDAIKAIGQMTDEQRKNWETLDSLTKAQITYREFLRQSAYAQGAAAKAAADGTTAYQQAGAALSRLALEVGNNIDPIGKGLAGAFTTATNAITAYIQEEQRFRKLRQEPIANSDATDFGQMVRDQARFDAQNRGGLTFLEPRAPDRLLGADDDIEARRARNLEALRIERGNQAARDAQTARSQATALAAIAREAASENTRIALEELGKRRAAEAKAASDAKERITDVRDADIAAAGARRDAALAALDQEAQGRSRARTLEDRERSASQEAILRGLEEAHNASLKGLDEQANAIQKRRDDSVSGIEAEIRAVDRKRDAAIRAIDEETRAESRRHDEALRNIDAERDRKLGIIDQQLKALDAAAQRDQRRQTDLSLARSLSDAKRDLKEADTPEERARAQRAVADAQAAIRREQVNRQREDQRAALQAQAEQIRAAADTARQIEAARNLATTESLSARQRTANDQAKADTDRLNATKARVEEESKIELDSIKTRVDAEKVAYDQTVQDARDSFKQINDAVADRRVGEDAELAARRVAVQTHYAGEQADIKATADAQLTALEKSTADTNTELDKQKEAWSTWARHVEAEIKAAITAGDPDRIKRIAGSPAAGENAGRGPGEPPSRDEAASLLTAAQRTGSEVAAGIAAGIGSDASVAAATAATGKLIQGGVIDQAKTLLRIESPSKTFEEFGTDTAQGFLNGYQARDLAAPIRAPFEESIRWMDGLPDAFRASGGNTSTAWQAGYQQLDLFAVGRQPFEQLRDWIDPGFANFMGAVGTNAAIAWLQGYAANDIFARGRLPFEQLDVWMAGVPPRFQVVGQNSGVAMVRGMADGLRTSFATVQYVWYRDFDSLGTNLAISLTNGFKRHFYDNPLQTPALQGSTQTTPIRDFGGPVQAGQPYLIGLNRKPELFVPEQAGSVLPLDTVQSSMMAVASGQAVGSGGPTSVTIQGPLVGSVTVTNEADEDRLVSKMATTIAQLIASTSLTRPGAPGTLIGA